MATLRALLVLVAVLSLTAVILFLLVVGRDIEAFEGKLPKLGEPAPAVDEFFLDKTMKFADQQRGSRVTTDDESYVPLAPAPQGSGLPAGHWCAANTIGYRIDFTGADLSGISREAEVRRWESVFDQWSQASDGQYTFEYRGTATFPMSDDSDGLIANNSLIHNEIAISYATSTHKAQPEWNAYRLPALDDKLGIGGIIPVSWSELSGHSGQITRGMLVIDVDDVPLMGRGTPAPYVHEAGHALGLAHTANEKQVMFAGAGMNATIGAGDRTGITYLGGLGCS
ncbi:MAG: hypothetical protein KDC39_00680 [Actinobacteria bacterium]|nr:hypothetical protein [Actinomycetota bacterium]